MARGSVATTQLGVISYSTEVNAMSGFFRIAAALTFLPIQALSAQAETILIQEISSGPRITVLVYNTAKVRAAILDRAEKEAARIYRDAGIELEWRLCPCGQQAGPRPLLLRIIPRLFVSNLAGFRDEHLGFAPSGQGDGVLATIFYHRVEELTKGGDPSCVLGHAIAHELGHLLLGQKAHSLTGLMRPHWSRGDLKRADGELLQFTPEQAERLRANVSARVKQQETLQAPELWSPR
jgi:hypothetical protein